MRPAAHAPAGDDAVLPVVRSGAAGRSVAAEPQHASPSIRVKPPWRAGMEEWLATEQRRGGTGPPVRSRMARSSSRSDFLTPLRGGGRPRTTAVRKTDASSRRSKSAEPGMALALTMPHSISSHLAGWSHAALPGVLDAEGPQSRTKVLPLVPNRAARNQVDDFYSELREAAEAGRVKFKEGRPGREQQRKAAQAKASRVLFLGDEALEPLTHPQFLEKLDHLNAALCSMEDEYDSDELEETRVHLLEGMRDSWHFSRKIDPRQNSSAPDENPEVGSPPRSCKLPSRRNLRSSWGSSRNRELPETPQLDSYADRKNIYHTQHVSPAERLRHLNQLSAVNISFAAVKQNEEIIQAFAQLGLEPHPAEVDLHGRRDILTPKIMEAIVEIFEGIRGDQIGFRK